LSPKTRGVDPSRTQLIDVECCRAGVYDVTHTGASRRSRRAARGCPCWWRCRRCPRGWPRPRRRARGRWNCSAPSPGAAPDDLAVSRIEADQLLHDAHLVVKPQFGKSLDVPGPRQDEHQALRGRRMRERRQARPPRLALRRPQEFAGADIHRRNDRGIPVSCR
jgi:hypothetical protein